LCRFGDAEVGDQDVTAAVEQDVVWLDVAVDDAPGVRFGEMPVGVFRARALAAKTSRIQ